MPLKLTTVLGHEMMFAAFLCCLYKIGVFTEEDAVAVVLKLFFRYFTFKSAVIISNGLVTSSDFLRGSESIFSSQQVFFLWVQQQFLRKS